MTKIENRARGPKHPKWKGGISLSPTYKRDWLRRHPEKMLAYHQKQWSKMRHSVLILIGKGEILCSRCGCDDEAIIQINHKNLGGCKEDREFGTRRNLMRIRDGKRSIEDLELLCRVCNQAHYVEMTRKVNYKIVWKKRK